MPYQFLTANQYLPLVEVIQKMGSDGLPAFELTSLFAHEKEQIYADNIHFLLSPDGNQSRGNELMAVHIANQLELTWKLKRKAGTTAGVAR